MTEVVFEDVEREIREVFPIFNPKAPFDAVYTEEQRRVFIEKMMLNAGEVPWGRESP